MNLDSRMRRRQRNRRTPAHDREALSPVAHVAEPTGRTRLVGQLLDHFDPVFDSDLPGNAYVWGPAGAGKSAVLTALASRFREDGAGSIVHSAARETRTEGERPTVVYVDARTAGTEFKLYHAVLDGLVDEPVPRSGIKAAWLRSRIQETLAPDHRQAVVAVDHVGEPGTYPLATVAEWLDRIEAPVSWLAVGRTAPDDLDGAPRTCIEVPAYRTESLVSVVSNRAREGLSPGAIAHEQVADIAEWAAGNAHDALAALYGAADRAATQGTARIESSHVADTLAAIPRPSVSLSRPLLLSPNRRRVLRALVSGDHSESRSVADVADRVAASDRVDLSAGTVKRFLYELADEGIVARHSPGTADRSVGPVEPRFAPQVFRRLDERTG